MAVLVHRLNQIPPAVTFVVASFRKDKNTSGATTSPKTAVMALSNMPPGEKQETLREKQENLAATKRSDSS